MENKFKTAARAESSHDEHIRSEKERINAKLRHFRGVAASVMNDALNLWEEIWRDCQDPRTCQEILDGVSDPAGQIPACGRPEFREKLHLLGHYIDYTKRLCEGSIDDPSEDESE